MPTVTAEPFAVTAAPAARMPRSVCKICRHVIRADDRDALWSTDPRRLGLVHRDCAGTAP
jgi:hypothetical protein